MCVQDWSSGPGLRLALVTTPAASVLLMFERTTPTLDRFHPDMFAMCVDRMKWAS